MVYAGTTWKAGDPEPVEQREPGKVIRNSRVAARLLPTFDGPFFGCLEYDEDYLNGVISTRDWIVSMLKDRDEGVPGAIYYSAWW
jgi:hypothetical protein